MSEDLERELLQTLRELRDAVRGLGAAAKPSMTVLEAKKVLGCGRNRVFELIADGSLRKVKVGRETHVTTDSVYAVLGVPTPTRSGG